MEHESRSWWTREQREQLERFHEDLSSQVSKTLGWPVALRSLQNKYPSLSSTTLERWRRNGMWDLRVLYDMCKMVDYDPWQAALAVGALPDDATGMERALAASTVLAIERYYRIKRAV